MLVQLADDIESKRQDIASATIAKKFRKTDRDSNIVLDQHIHVSEFHVSGADLVGSVNANVNSANCHVVRRYFWDACLLSTNHFLVHEVCENCVCSVRVVPCSSTYPATYPYL